MKSKGPYTVGEAIFRVQNTCTTCGKLFRAGDQVMSITVKGRNRHKTKHYHNGKCYERAWGY